MLFVKNGGIFGITNGISTNQSVATGIFTTETKDVSALTDKCISTEFKDTEDNIYFCNWTHWCKRKPMSGLFGRTVTIEQKSS